MIIAQNKNKTCRIGILGAGRIGKMHAENIKYCMPRFNLIAIADPNLDREWAQSLQIPIATQHWEEIIANTEIDAILIASPSPLHCEQIKAASHAGKAIFCEKPIGLDEEEIISTLQIINEHKTLLQLGFNRRFDPNFATIKKRVQSGEIGDLQLLRIASRDPACPSEEFCATSGGLFMDMTIHDFDMARFLTGSEVAEVYTMGSVLINPFFEKYNDIDTAIVQLRFANGALAVIDNSRQAVYGYDQRVEVLGSKGMLLAENQLEHNVKFYSDENTSSVNPLQFFLQRYKQAFLIEFESFYDAWLNKKPSPVCGEDGLQAIRIAKAANQSLKTNMPVSLS